MKALLIKHKKHLWRIPVGLLIIGLFALSPILIGLIGAYITELNTGKPCHEGNCYWMSMPWYLFITFPIAGVFFLVFLLIVINDWSKLKKQ
ncbi:hypothetical protein ACFSQJ_03775 [Croceitalea marina]|uniref:Uncharacterized protein n=1 Tax=Croceitalea marina TaxID=1775166 RepID=A0ABW5MRX7_9FLAO